MSLELNTLSFHEILVLALFRKSFNCAHVLIAIERRFWISAAWFTVSVSRLPKYTACCLLGTVFPLWYLVVDFFCWCIFGDSKPCCRTLTPVRFLSAICSQRSGVLPENMCIIRKNDFTKMNCWDWFPLLGVLSLDLMSANMTDMTNMKRYAEGGHPCLMPHC